MGTHLMIFTSPDSPWYIALADSLIAGVTLIVAIITVVAFFTCLIAELIHSASGYNGERPTKFWWTELRIWWKDPEPEPEFCYFGVRGCLGGCNGCRS